MTLHIEPVMSVRKSPLAHATQVRTRNFEPPLDLSSCDTLRLRVKGDGLRYKVTLRTSTNWDGIGYTQ